MAASLFLLLIAGGACLSYIEATTVVSPHLRSKDSYNRLPRTINAFQNRKDVVEEARSGGAEWPQQNPPSVLTQVISCGEGDSFSVSSQKHGDLAGCYMMTAQHNGEALYTPGNRVGRKYMVAATTFNETNANPDVHWTLARMDSLHHDILCISVDFAYHTHPVDASWTCDFSPRDMVPIAANLNDITFSCGCPLVTHNLRYKTAYHRRTTDGDGNAGFLSIVGVIIVGIVIRVLFKLFWRGIVQQPPRVVERQIVFERVPTRSARGAQCSSSTETARNSQTSATTLSNEPGSEIEMMRPLRPPGGAADKPGDLLEEEEGIL